MYPSSNLCDIDINQKKSMPEKNEFLQYSSGACRVYYVQNTQIDKLNYQIRDIYHELKYIV